MSAELEPYAPPVPEEYRPRLVMNPAEAKALDRQLREAIRAVLIEGTDYGTIPGTGGGPSLWQPGAEKLLQFFGFGYVNDVRKTRRGDDGQPAGVTYRCVVHKDFADGRRITISTCDGYAGYDEDKFYIPAEKARARAEDKERAFARKDRRAPKPERWENVTEYRAPWNTLVKMAQKRALVGAVKGATGASGIFGTDLDQPTDASPADGVPPGARAAASPAAPAGGAPPAPAVPPGPETAAGAAVPGAYISRRFTELGIDDQADRLILAAEILRLDEIPADSRKLTAPQLVKLMTVLSAADTLEELRGRSGRLRCRAGELFVYAGLQRTEPRIEPNSDEHCNGKAAVG